MEMENLVQEWGWEDDEETKGADSRDNMKGVTCGLLWSSNRFPVVTCSRLWFSGIIYCDILSMLPEFNINLHELETENTIYLLIEASGFYLYNWFGPPACIRDMASIWTYGFDPHFLSYTFLRLLQPACPEVI